MRYSDLVNFSEPLHGPTGGHRRSAPGPNRNTFIQSMAASLAAGEIFHLNPAMARLLGFPGPLALLADMDAALQLLGLPEEIRPGLWRDRVAGPPVLSPPENGYPQDDCWQGDLTLALARQERRNAPLHPPAAGMEPDQASPGLRPAGDMDGYFREMADSLGQGLWLTNREDRVIYVNPAFEDITGLEGKALAGKVFSSAQAAAIHGALGRFYSQARISLEPVIFSGAAYAPPGGPLRRISGMFTPRISPDGGFRGMLSTLWDVTEESREVGRRERERLKLFSILDAMPAFVALQDGNNHFRYANRAFNEQFGEHEGVLCHKAFLGREERCPVCLTDQVLQDGRSRVKEWTAPSGRTYQMYHYPFQDLDGEPMVLKLGFDISQRKQAEEELKSSEDKFRVLSDNAPLGIMMLTEGRILHANPYLEDLLGRPRGGLTGLAVEEILSPQRREEFLGSLAGGRGIIRVEPAGGGERWLEYLANPITRAGKSGMILTFQDVTGRRRLENQYQMALKVFENSSEGILAADAEGRVRMVNPAYTRITGFEAKEAIGGYLDVLREDHIAASLYQEIWEALQKKGQWSGEHWSRRKSGEAYPEWLTLSVIRNGEGAVENYLAIIHDLTDIKKGDAKITYQAHHDALTGLPNRGLFTDRLTHSLAHAERNGLKLGLMFLDLDHFKEVNDTLGHEVGDLLLKEVAGILRDSVREEDTAARLGGDEFVVILTDLADGNAAVRVARAILEKLAHPLSLGPHRVKAGASIGISLYPDDGLDAEVLIKHADMAMYRAKNQGRNNFQLYTPHLQQEASRRQKVEEQIQKALDDGRVALLFQPVVHLSSGRVVGSEALLRLVLPDGKLELPRDFLPVAEESGLILPLGAWALWSALHHMLHWDAQGLVTPLKVGVNISPRQFLHPGLAGDLRGLLEETGAEPSRLVLEISESTLMDKPDRSRRILADLTGLGVKLIMDDYGTAPGSLYHLQKFPLYSVKLDTRFTSRIGRSREDDALAKALLGAAASLGLRVIAEGMETEEQREFLRAHGCQLAQGNLAGRPMSPGEFLTLISR